MTKQILMILISLLVGPIARSQVPQPGTQAQIFLLENKSQGIRCTATLFRYSRNQCALVTNAHCLGKSNDTLNLAEIQHSLPEVVQYRSGLKPRTDFQVKVIKASAPQDLAELTIPDELKKAHCGNDKFGLSVPQIPGVDDLMLGDWGVVSLGFFNEKPIATYSGQVHQCISNRGMIGWPACGESHRDAYITEIPEWPYAVRVYDHTIFHGMSGGPTFSQSETLIGINVWLREQAIEEAYFIALADVVRFLNKAPHKIILYELRHPNLPAAGDNDHDTGGDNGHGSGGDNGHGSGGDNGHGSGGDNGHGSGGDQGQGPKLKNLSSLLLPPEGIVNPQNPDEIILGIDGSSVDGMNDYVRLNTKKEKHDYVTKPNAAESSPPEAVIKSFFQRLVGSYHSFKFFSIANPHTGRTHIFQLDETSGMYEKLDQVGEPEIEVDISNDQLQIKSGRFLWNRGDTGIDIMSGFWPGFLLKFDLKFSEDGRKVFLTPTNDSTGPILEAMTCDNRQYLKINCAGPHSVLSLHNLDKTFGRTEINFGYIPDGNPKFIIQEYGDLTSFKRN